MEKLTLQNPITINGKKVKTLTYDTDAITVGMFADAEARKLRATSNKGAAALAPASSTTPCTPISP